MIIDSLGCSRLEIQLEVKRTTATAERDVDRPVEIANLAALLTDYLYIAR